MKLASLLSNRSARWALAAASVPLVAVSAGCGAKAKSALQSAVGDMTFGGTVNRAGTKQAVTGAHVVLIPLATLDAVKQLMEVKKIPDGKGGEAERLRIRLDMVQAYIAAHDTVKATTDAQGKFSVKAPINAYLVYTYGPDSGPGSTPVAYGPHFWGINPVTGELDKDHLIGADLKLTQSNDAIQLPGGPVAPAPPPAATAQPKTTAVVPPVPPSPPLPVQPEPKPGETDLPRGDLVPPAAAAGYWASIKLAYSGGALGTGNALQADKAALPEGQRYLELDAELAAAQTDPVYLVLQKGFDSSYVSGCDGTVSAATVRVYPVAVNGTHVTYQLVPPGPFYKLFFAKKAVQAKDGEAPATVDSATDTLTVGKRECDFAVPERPFVATLTWDQQVDLDLHVSKFDAGKVKAAASADDVGAALVDQANYTNRQGTTLSLDVDNVYGYGPETNGESAAEAHPDAFCYMVQVHYYAGAAAAVAASVDVTQVATEGGKKVIKQLASKVTLGAAGDWRTIGAFGPAECAKLLNPPAAVADVIAYPPAADCVTPASCDLAGDKAGQYKASLTLDKASFAASEAVKVSYLGMPEAEGNWITIVPKSQPDNSWCSWQWASGATGSQTYGGLPAGDYEVRLYYNWTGTSGAGGGQCEVIGRQAFTVTP